MYYGRLCQCDEKPAMQWSRQVSAQIPVFSNNNVLKNCITNKATTWNKLKLLFSTRMFGDLLLTSINALKIKI